MGVHRALVVHARARLLADARNPDLAADVLEKGDRALATLEEGLGHVRREDREPMSGDRRGASHAGTAVR